MLQTKQSKNPFPIGAELQRLTRSGKNTKKVWARSYARLETAIRRASELMILDGEVGDVIEIFYKSTGLQIGVVRMTARGKVEMTWSEKWVVREPKPGQPRYTAKEALYKELVERLH